MSGNISQTIRERVKRIGDGELFTISDFEDINNDDLVTRSLSRSQNEAIIVRVATGIYMDPKKTQFGILLPILEKSQLDKFNYKDYFMLALNYFVRKTGNESNLKFTITAS